MSDDAIVFEPADYWKLMKLQGDLEAATFKASLAIAPAQTAHDAFARALAVKYPAFQIEDAHYRADDATCSLVRER